MPILHPTVYRSGFSGSHYNPRTLLTRVISGGNAIDDPDFVNKTFEYNATVVHERVHWLQHHGTSFGAFLEALRYSQQVTTLTWLREIPPDDVVAMLAARASATKQILTLDPKSQYPIFDPDGDSNPLNLFRQIWYDHQWVHLLLEDSRVCESVGIPPKSAVGEIIGDVMLSLCSDGGFDCQNGDLIRTNASEPRRWYTFDSDAMGLVRVNGERLTTKMIMEAPATIAEMRLLPAEAWNTLLGHRGRVDAITQRLRAIVEGDYGVPVRSLLAIRGDDICMISDVLPTVSVLCYLALNPPLPPYVMSPPATADSWAWDDIYPPTRFTRLCYATNRVGLIADCRDHHRISEYISALLNESQLPSTIGLEFPEHKPPADSPDFEDVATQYPAGLTARHHDYVFWVQSKLAALREKSLPFVVSFGDCLTGDLSITHFNDVLALDEKTIPFARCPLHWTDSGKIGFSCPVEFGQWLVQSVALHHVLFDVVAGVGDFDMGAFPPELGKREFQEVLRNSILANLTNVRNEP